MSRYKKQAPKLWRRRIYQSRDGTKHRHLIIFSSDADEPFFNVQCPTLGVDTERCPMMSWRGGNATVHTFPSINSFGLLAGTYSFRVPRYSFPAGRFLRFESPLRWSSFLSEPCRSPGPVILTRHRFRPSCTLGRRQISLDISSALYYTVRRSAYPFIRTHSIRSVYCYRNCHRPVLPMYECAGQSNESHRGR